MKKQQVARQVEDEKGQAEGEEDCVGEGGEQREGRGEREERGDAGAWRVLARSLTRRLGDVDGPLSRN